MMALDESSVVFPNTFSARINGSRNSSASAPPELVFPKFLRVRINVNETPATKNPIKNQIKR